MTLSELTMMCTHCERMGFDIQLVIPRDLTGITSTRLDLDKGPWSTSICTLITGRNFAWFNPTEVRSWLESGEYRFDLIDRF